MDVLIGIDRDDTIIKDEGWPGSRWPNEAFVFRPGVLEGIRFLRSIPGARLAMITNQAGPARDKVKIEHLPAIHKHILSLLDKQGAGLHGVWYCEHVPEVYAREKGIALPHSLVKDCPDSKPGIGMLQKAAQHFFQKPVQECRVYMIGDRHTDVLTGLNAGGKGVFVPGDYENGNREEAVAALQREHGSSVCRAKDFLDAAQWIVQDLQ